MSMSRGLSRGLQLCKTVRSAEEVGFAASTSALQHLRYSDASEAAMASHAKNAHLLL